MDVIKELIGEGELQFVCPETGVVNRLLFSDHDVPFDERRDHRKDPEQQFSRKYRRLFKGVVKTYGGTPDNRVNNCYVDDPRKYFGLVERRESSNNLGPAD